MTAASQGPDGRSARRVLLDADLAGLAGRMRGTVLEIGNGREPRRGWFAPPAPGVDRWVFVDRDRSRRPHCCGDVMHLPFAAARFDTVVCLEVLEYVRQPAVAMTEMGRVLREGGSLIVSTPFATRPDTETDLWRFTANGLRELARSAGFAHAEVLPQGGVPAVIAHMLPHWTGAARWRRAVVARLAAPAAGMSRPRDDGYTTGYVLVARKPSAAGAGA